LAATICSSAIRGRSLGKALIGVNHSRAGGTVGDTGTNFIGIIRIERPAGRRIRGVLFLAGQTVRVIEDVVCSFRRRRQAVALTVRRPSPPKTSVPGSGVDAVGGGGGGGGGGTVLGASSPRVTVPARSAPWASDAPSAVRKNV